ncbi:hypothetical protein [Cohnella fermenti]|uniref:Uncharacterized protein n=1 Tax=Cohnella fermenti TaxID=2565925 RepID=A0A4S4BK67_9BACL|nr:hypothetical protein [Cohnella fermenti]THF74141.1 hypothetical protein E6C55_26300 [Cohnella fermenti]
MTIDYDAASGSQTERMDRWLIAASEHKLNADNIIRLIKLVFRIDVGGLPFSPSGESAREIIRNYMDLCRSESVPLSGAGLRATLNLALGVNLDALSALEGSRISIYSKNQWMIRQETDLFIVHTGAQDIDVRIYPTPFFWMSYTGDSLPDEYMTDMLLLGYDFDEDSSSHFYRNPTGGPVDDAFKGRTIQILRRALAGVFSRL